MNMADIQYRLAAREDASAIAALFRRVRKACLPYLPTLHSPAEDVEYFFGRVLNRDTVWVAERENLAGFCAFTEGWLDHLYVDAPFQRRGVGSALLRRATAGNGVLQLWVFQQNVEAIRFYESHGFSLVEKTDGSNNEEGAPDALYRLSVKP